MCRRGTAYVPETSVADAIKAVATRTTVMRRRRMGVSHVNRRVASQLRSPVAAAALVAAVIMH